MDNMTLNNISLAVNGQYFGGEADKKKVIAGISIDSRKIERDFLFIPVKGERADGHNFVGDVKKKGALCVLSEKKLSEECEPYILVSSTLQAIKDLAEFYRSTLGVKVVGVTGSVGKTTTKEMIAAVLEQKYNVLKTKGNFNNEIGLPLTIFKIKKEHEVAVLEMGISDFGEMHRLSKIAKPDICVITNIGTCHLENLHNREGVLKAKAEIFDYIDPDGSAVLNGDDDLLVTIEKNNNFHKFFYGIGNKNQIYADNIQSNGLNGTNFDILYEDKRINIELTVPGEYMIYNALAAAAVARQLGLSDRQIKKGIEAFETMTGRARFIKKDFITIIDDCYNANPMSMKAAIDTLSGAEGRRVCILGDMFELGDDTKKFHRQTGEYASEKNTDIIICIGSLSRYMYEGALSKNNHSKIYYFETKEELMIHLLELIKEKDTILVKASHGMKFEEIVDFLDKEL